MAVAFLRIKQLDPGFSQTMGRLLHSANTALRVGFPFSEIPFSRLGVYRFHLFGRHHDNGAGFHSRQYIMVTCAEFPQGHHLQ